MSLEDKTWRPGWVISRWGRTKVEPGQRWRYVAKVPVGHVDLIDAEITGDVLPLTVVSTSPEGEVVLRPSSKELAERLFPEQETMFKGKPIKTRNCPFMWVGDIGNRKHPAAPQEGDLMVHEAWDVWQSMHLHQ
jgi:hypothetical protein